MAVDKFKFVSPGVFIEEIDESALPPLPERMGPMIVGRFEKGPSNRPIKVDSFREFVQVFGNPSPGVAAGDVWRSGAQTAPTYAAYAAQAWLRNNSPCTVLRLLGKESVDAEGYSSAPKSKAGWTTDAQTATNLDTVGGAYGLFVMPNPDQYASPTATATWTLSGESNDFNDGAKFTLYDATGATSEFTYETSDDVVNGTTIGIGSYDGGSSTTAKKQGITWATWKAINSSSAGFTAVNNGDLTLTITQTAGGTIGNRDNTQDAGNVGWTLGNFAGAIDHAVTGTLAAVWYVQDGAVMLTGTTRNGDASQGAATLFRSTDQQFTAVITSSAGVTKKATFNFDSTSDLYVRKVFNTNPTKTNADTENLPSAGGSQEKYWLGETFETNVQKNLAVTGSLVGSTGTNKFLGVILGLDGTAGSSVDWHDRLQANVPARTGWFISQDNRGNTNANFNPAVDVDELFRIHALDSGESANRDLKISIQDIKAPSDNFNNYGTFTLVVRQATDNDSKPVVLERFSGLNLNRTSANYIAKRIGDKEYTFDAATNVLRESGQYRNISNLIRVEVSPKVKAGEAGGLLPFGVRGPVVFKTWQLLSGSTADALTDNAGVAMKEYVIGSGSTFPTDPNRHDSIMPDNAVNRAEAAGSPGMVWHGDVLASAFTASIEWPSTRLRVSSSEGGLVKGSQAYFGYNSVVEGTRRFDKTNIDLLRGGPASFNGTDGAAGSLSDTAAYQYSWIFTLDDVEVVPTDSRHARWVSGSRAAGDSYTGADSSSNPSQAVLDAGYNRFTSPMFGGFDGWDVTERDPLRNTYLNEGSETNNHAFYTVKKALDMVSDAEFVEYDLLTIPGITNNSLNNRMVNICEDRADALAILDLQGNFKPEHETDGDETSRLGNITTLVNNLKDMNINSSYGCAFYPFVQIRDMINDSILYVPPSVVALGTMSSSQRKSAVWFAPAGFTRGGLSEGSAGLPVIGVRQRLTADDRDKLYDANVNPIATFPAEGIVIFGQKTLQVTPSALDRINVRRLLIFLKKEISRISSRLLFEQNVQATWDRFTGQVVPFLENVQSGLGLTDFKVVLDDSTTTPDLVDRNVLYAKIYLKPARAIEFIALDFIIARSGASFDD